MPTYEYACTACGHRLEAVQSFTDDPLSTCPECGGDLRKVYGAVGIVLKGSGFYKTDSRAAASGKAGETKPGETKPGDTKSGESTSSESTSSESTSSGSSSGDGSKTEKKDSSSSGGSGKDAAPAAASTSKG